MATALAELVKVPDAPLQVVVGAGEVCTLRLAGTVSVKLDWVKSKPLVLPNVMVSVEATFSPHTRVGSREAYRRNLYWLTVSLRLVCRGLYICMHSLIADWAY